ncbi:MAG: response regulator [Myxococcaceae bacterium]|nr:MAG: response regulator [Myxococcaceae bacterium]
MADATSARAVLVVDDDRDLRELVADILEGSGRRVFTASAGADALRQIDADGSPARASCSSTGS